MLSIQTVSCLMTVFSVSWSWQLASWSWSCCLCLSIYFHTYKGWHSHIPKKMLNVSPSCEWCSVFSVAALSVNDMQKEANYRQDAAKRQTAGIVFTHRPKIRFFAPQGRLVAPIRVKLCRTDGHMGPLGLAEFHVNWCRGWECGPENIKNFHFLVKSRPAGATPLTDFEKFSGFYTSNYPTLAIQISCDSHHRLRSYCGETARR